jgi:hypothetical protein
MTMQMRMRVAIGVVSAGALMSAAVPTASAVQSVTAGTNTCTVTAVAPTLVKTTLTSNFKVVCTVSSVVTLEIGVVEMDGTLEDKVIPIAIKSVSVATTANKTVTAVGPSGTCVSTETGNEEYATKVRVNISGTVSAFDRSVPINDQYAC